MTRTATRVVSALLWTAAAVVVLAFPVAWAVDRLAGRDVILLAQDPDPGVVDVSRLAFDDAGLSPEERREQVVEIYGGSAATEAQRVVFVDDDRVLVPPEDPALALLRPGDGHPVQAKTLYFGAARVAIGALVALLLLALVRRRLVPGGT